MQIFHAPYYKRLRGFTLVELLITLIIIGILAGLLVFGIGQMKAKATATKIIADLRTLRSAVAMRYSDTKTWPTGGTGTWDWVKDYIDTDALSSTNPTGAEKQKIYAIRVFQTGVNTGRMFVVANVNDNRILGIDDLVRLKISERQDEYKLLNNSILPYIGTDKILMIEIKK
ncbi:MAG: prepilin-type N-terminal cleavage/methylation domain-containing protein [Synergistaceae bacterium]|nr:prepilin-type N-terminal cleavage/methylation domain-containing protein [Synergistaceae bacterium]